MSSTPGVRASAQERDVLMLKTSISCGMVSWDGERAHINALLQLLPGEVRVVGKAPASGELVKGAFGEVQQRGLVDASITAPVHTAIAKIPGRFEPLDPFLGSLVAALEVEILDVVERQEARLKERAENGKIPLLYLKARAAILYRRHAPSL